MPFQPVENTAAFTMVGRASTGTIRIENTIYGRPVTGAWTEGDLSAMAETIGGLWASEIVPEFSSNYTFDRVEYRDLTEEFGISGTAEFNEVGGDAGAALSGLDCVYVALTGAGGSPPRRGSLFLSPFVEADLTIDTWSNSTKLSALETGLTLIQAEMLLGDVNWVIVSRYSKEYVDPEADPPNLRGLRPEGIANRVVEITVQSNLATQRDRRAGQGV